jgi:hypothetical protein
MATVLHPALTIAGPRRPSCGRRSRGLFARAGARLRALPPNSVSDNVARFLSILFLAAPGFRLGMLIALVQGRAIAYGRRRDVTLAETGQRARCHGSRRAADAAFLTMRPSLPRLLPWGAANRRPTFNTLTLRRPRSGRLEGPPK